MKKKVILGILVIFLIALVPLFALRDADFGGSDDAASLELIHEYIIHILFNRFKCKRFKNYFFQKKDCAFTQSFYLTFGLQFLFQFDDY